MAGFTNTIEADLLNYFVNTYAPATKYVALSTSTPAEDGTGFTEPAEASYARVATTSADWAAATGGAPSVKANSATITFPAAAEDWAAGVNFTYFGIFSAATAGTLQKFGALGTPKPVLTDDTASFSPGALVLKLGDPGDVY